MSVAMAGLSGWHLCHRRPLASPIPLVAKFKRTLATINSKGVCV